MGYYADGTLTVTYEESFFDSFDKQIFLDWLASEQISEPDESVKTSSEWILYLCCEVGGYEENDIGVDSKGMTIINFYFSGKSGDWVEAPLNFLGKLGFGIAGEFTGEDHHGWSYANSYKKKSIPRVVELIQINSEVLADLETKATKYDSISKTLAKDPERSWTSKTLSVYLKLEEFSKA